MEGSGALRLHRWNWWRGWAGVRAPPRAMAWSAALSGARWRRSVNARAKLGSIPSSASLVTNTLSLWTQGGCGWRWRCRRLRCGRGWVDWEGERDSGVGGDPRRWLSEAAGRVLGWELSGRPERPLVAEGWGSARPRPVLTVQGSGQRARPSGPHRARGVVRRPSLLLPLYALVDARASGGSRRGGAPCSSGIAPGRPPRPCTWPSSSPACAPRSTCRTQLQRERWWPNC